MPGTHQIVNASAAISAFLLLQCSDGRRQAADSSGRNGERKPNGFQYSGIRNALRNVSLPLRFEIVRPNDESPTFIFDGAHNRASMQAFVQTAREMFPNRRLLLIFGTSLGKDAEGMFAEIDGHFHHVFLTQFSDSNRRFPPQELRSIFALPEANVTIKEKCEDAWEQCIQMADNEDVVCITGSLYLSAELLKRSSTQLR